MLSMSDTPITFVLPIFSRRGIPVAFLVPTPTGFQKSIMDAIGDLRLFLRDNHLHDYSLQNQGQDNKITIKSFFVYADHLQETYASLYRPVTKQGDPRIWFYNLKQYCQPRNLLAITTYQSELYIFNMSRPEIRNSFFMSGSFPASILEQIYSSVHSVAEELLSKLRIIHSRGFLPTVTCGDTGVGMTLESHLGLPPNCNRAPDYKGIELKASRMNHVFRTPNRVNLFTQVPSWKESRLSANDILERFGYVREGRLQLYCTVSHKPNPQGLFFVVDSEADILHNMANDTGQNEKIALWSLSQLRDCLARKHHETFWVKASTRHENGTEFFRYDTVIHTQSPNINLFGALVSEGIITMDYTLSRKGNGVRDHGYIFKIQPNSINLLFPEPTTIQL